MLSNVSIAMHALVPSASASLYNAMTNVIADSASFNLFDWSGGCNLGAECTSATEHTAKASRWLEHQVSQHINSSLPRTFASNPSSTKLRLENHHCIGVLDSSGCCNHRIHQKVSNIIHWLNIAKICWRLGASQKHAYIRERAQFLCSDFLDVWNWEPAWPNRSCMRSTISSSSHSGLRPSKLRARM